MILDQIKYLPPFERLTYWIQERESIRLKRAKKKPAPWTDDPILQTYRFCNVRRMDDKVSQWLLTNWYQPYFNHRNMIAAVCIARFINLPSSLQLLTSSIFDTPKEPAWFSIMGKLRRAKEGGPIFNAAYMVRGNDGVDKVESVIRHNVQPLVSKLKKDDLGNCLYMEAIWNLIKDAYGFGSFMAGQVVADLRWAIHGRWVDRNDWAPVGPGSARGMARLLNNDVKQAKEYHNQSLFNAQLEIMIRNLKKALPKSITSRLEAHDYQNCLCEFDKYNRVLFGEGRPKQLYRGGV